jgi:hypothetical protein
MPGTTNQGENFSLVRPLAADTIHPETPAEIPLRLVIRDELSAVQRNRAELMTPRGPWVTHVFVLVLCVLVNVILYQYHPDYFGLFIAASFYLNMYYFITLILPTNFERKSMPAADFSRVRTWLKEIGVTSGTTQFSRLFINTLFMNSRALTLGICLIFSLDIAFTLVHYTQGLPLRITVIVITQCAIIVTFYLLVWKMEPFSTTYVKKVEQVKRHLHRRNLPPRFVTAVFLFGFMLAIFLFLTTIIYLPGVTLKAFLNQSDLRELGHLFSLLAILAFSQYFIIRYIHGFTSRTMADRLFDFKVNSLRDLLDAETETPPADPGPEQNPLERGALLLESKIFIVKRSTLAGAFPVFVVDLDFSVLMDTTTLTAIKGYIVERKR